MTTAPIGCAEVLAVTTCFAAIGQGRDDPDRLLLLRDDGRFYGLSLPDGEAAPADPTDGGWELDGDVAGADATATDALVSRLFDAGGAPSSEAAARSPGEMPAATEASAKASKELRWTVGDA